MTILGLHGCDSIASHWRTLQRSNVLSSLLRYTGMARQEAQSTAVHHGYSNSGSPACIPDEALHIFALHASSSTFYQFSTLLLRLIVIRGKPAISHGVKSSVRSF